MSDDQPPQISILDARLADIDRRLGAIQTGLLDRQETPAGPIAEPALPPADVPPRVEIPEPAVPPADVPLRVEIPEPAVPPADVPPRVEIPEPAVPPADVPPRVEIPEPPAARVSGLREATAETVAELHELSVAHGRLLESLQRLVGSYERTLTRSEQPPPTPATPTQFSVSAGPFASTEALHRFECTLAQIPEVRDVQVRGYEGEDRAIVDVHLHDATS